MAAKKPAPKKRPVKPTPKRTPNPFAGIKKGGFHKWLGKAPGSPITAADIAKGLASKDPHVRKMANFAKNAKRFHH